MALYSVCSHLIESDKMPQRFLPFLKTGGRENAPVDLSIRYTSDLIDSSYQIAEVTTLPYMAVSRILLPDKGYCWVYRLQNNSGSIVVNSDYSEATIHYRKEIEYASCGNLGEVFGQIIQIILECKLIYDGFVILHSSCVEKDGVAYAFTGPSGIGKSTRACKWCELLSAEMVSGDRPAINTADNMAYGVPWDGKEGIYRNVHFPLSAILIVKRSEAVNVKELIEEDEIMQVQSKQISIPMWDVTLAAKALHSLKNLIRCIPIYELNCGIDNQSILQSHEMISTMLEKRRK